jgi:hypothetical protein
MGASSSVRQVIWQICDVKPRGFDPFASQNQWRSEAFQRDLKGMGTVCLPRDLTLLQPRSRDPCIPRLTARIYTG